MAAGRVIVAHLGSGASMCALLGGRSIESTMGFTALDGLPMGTRPGQLDPGVVLYLIEEKGMSGSAVADPLYRESRAQGPLGDFERHARPAGERRPAGGLCDRPFRPPLRAAARASSRPRSAARRLRLHRRHRRKLRPIRARIAERLAWLGAELDPAANAAGAHVISTPASRVALLVIPTDEELMIARHTLALVAAGA